MAAAMLACAAALCGAVTAGADSAPATCQNDYGFDYQGGDLPAPWGNASSAAACCALCDANSACKFWSWIEDMSPQRCALKAKIVNRSPNPNRVSGSRTGGPAPPPSIPPGKPSHFFSCTANLSGGARLPFPMCDPTKDVATRVADIVSRLTVEEKAACLTTNGASVPRVGLPALGSAEDTHGIGCGCGQPATSVAADGTVTNSTGCPTTFPAGPGLGATYDRALWASIGEVIGTEGRALNNQQKCPLYFLDPDINLVRDPRWGRIQEVPGEDPYLTGEYGRIVIASTQAGPSLPGNKFTAVADTMKHWIIYDLEGYQPNTDPTPGPNTSKCDVAGHCSRATFDMYPNAQDLAGYYTKAFHTAATQGKPEAIMCAYNAEFGVPSCANPLNNQIAREQWGWNGWFVSDCGAVDLIQRTDGHHYTNNANATIRAALSQGGCDVNCGDKNPAFYTVNIPGAVASGAVTEADVDRAASRYFATLVRLGMLDPMGPGDQPLIDALTPDSVDSAGARAVALVAATEGAVLLKNDGVLPLDVTGGGAKGSRNNNNAIKGISNVIKGSSNNEGGLKIAFIGPHANSTQDLLSAPQYHGANTLVNSHSPLQVAQRRGWDVTFTKGCNICDTTPPGYPNMPCGTPNPPGPAPDTSGIPAAAAAAKAADVAVVFVGNDQTTEAENFDRVNLTLPGAQDALLQAVAAAQPNTVVVLINGGPVDVSIAKSSPAVRAILEAFQPGELGGDAICDLLSGSASPSGKMPYTTYTQDYVSRDIREMDLRADGGTTYYWTTRPTLWPFGYGLSYTNFTYKWSPSDPASAASASSPAISAAIPSLPAGDVTDEARAALAADATLATHTVVVTNTGHRASDCVVLAFVTQDAGGGSPPYTPLKRLFGFERLSNVAPGESRTVTFNSTAASMAVAEPTGAEAVQPGRYGVEVGDVVNPARVTLRLTGGRAVVRENAWARELASQRPRGGPPVADA